MDEILIRIDVESDPAVVGIEKVERALHNLDDEQGRVAKSSEKYSRDELGRFKAKEQAQVSELQRYRTGAKTIGDYRKEIEALTGAEIKRRSGLSDAAKKEPAELMRVYNTLEQVQRLRAQMSQEVLAQTGKTVSEITRMGKTIEAVGKQQQKADDDALRSAKRVADGRSVLDKAYNDSSIKRTKESIAAKDQMIAAFERRAAMFARQPQYNNSSSLAQDLPGFGSSGMTVSGANAVRAAQRQMIKDTEDAQREIERAEQESQGRRKARWEKFFKSILPGGGQRGGGFRSGGTRRSQFSDNPFLDTGGRGIQPRNLLIGGAIGGAAALAGPVGAAAGGLAGIIPGAVFGLGSAIAAIKMSGLSQVADQASKIRNLQAEIATGAIKEAKGRAQIAAILKQMSPEQQKALELWKGFYKVSQDIGNKVSDVLLPAFGQIGKALGSNSGTITRSVVTAGKAMADLITNMSKFISSGPGKVLFSGTASAGNTFITGLLRSLGDLGKVFLAVGNASQGFMHKVMGSLNGITAGMANWSTSFEGKKSLKGFFETAGQELDRVLGLVKDLGKVLITIFAAALPYSDRLIDGLRSVLQHFNTFLQSSRGQNDMKDIFNTLTATVKDFAAGIQVAWPIVSKLFSGIIGLVQLMNDQFGKAGAAIVIFAALAVKAIAGTVMKALAEMIATESAAALMNPWVAAIAGAAILIAAIATTQSSMDQLKQHANDTASAIRAAFDAKNKKKLDASDLPVATDRVNATRGSLGSALMRQAAAKSAVTSANLYGGSQTADRALAAANQDVNRLRSNYVHAKADRAALVQSINQDDIDKNNGIVKAADNAKAAWADALKSTQKWTGGGVRGNPQKSFTPPDLSVAKQRFAQFFTATGKDADSAGQRVQLVMDKIAAYTVKWNHAPSKKTVGLFLNDVASLPLKKVLALLALVKPKNVKISQTGGEGVLSIIHQIANEKIDNKTFKVIGTIINPKGNLPGVTVTPAVPTPGHMDPKTGQWVYSAKGGKVPGVGTGDTVPTMLTPGEVVLNKRQQQDFGGSAVFDNYFANSPVQHFAKGGVVQATRIIGDSPQSSLMIGPKGNVIGNTTAANQIIATPVMKTVSPMPNGAAEPGMDAVLAQLKGAAPAIKLLNQLIQSETVQQSYIDSHLLTPAKDARDALYKKQTAMSGEVDKKGSKYWLNKRKKISDDLIDIRKKIETDYTLKRQSVDRESADHKRLSAVSKVFTHIPGYESFQGQIAAANNSRSALVYAASLMPALDPNADPNALNGINTLDSLWNGYNTRYTNAGTSERDAIQTRVNWLATLLPGLKGRPKFTRLVNAETATDQDLMTSILGRSLSDAVPTGAGPGDTVTNPKTTDAPGTGNNMWADQPLTQTFLSRLSNDAADAAYALITNNADQWNQTMGDERDSTWGRLQDLQAVKDNPAYAAWRPDIIDEITSDSSDYGNIVQAIQGGFAQAMGGSSGQDQTALQQVIDDANTIMGQINLGSTVEREQLGLLSDYLRAQVPSYGTGISYVDRDKLAMVHKGEQIISRGDVAGGGGYGGGVLTLHPTGDALMDVLIQHIEPKITYKQGQSTRRRIREGRR